MKGSSRFLALSVALIVGVAACGTAEESTTVAPATTGVAPTTAPPVVDTTQPPAPVTGELTVLEWAFYEVPEMWVEFGQEYPDVEVVFNFGANDEDIFAKILAGSGEDIVHFYTPALGYYVDEGLLQEIDTSQLANWDKVPAGFQESCTVDGKVYCVPWDWGFTSILYNTDQIPEVTSWNALFDEAYAGHVSMWDNGPGAVQIGCYVIGCNEDNVSDGQLAEIQQLWIDQKDVNLFYWVEEPGLEEGFTSGDVWAAYAWNGAFYRLLSAGIPVAYADPVEGRNSWIGQYGINASSENRDLALAFLDGKLGELTATNLLVDYAYGHVVPDYWQAVTDEALVTALSLDDPTILERTNFTVPITAEDRDRFVAMWAEVLAAP